AEMEKASKAEVGYVPGPDFVEDNKESLIDIEMNENTELWLIQLPNDQFPDFDGQKVSLELDGDGPLGTIEAKSGKQYSLVNYPAEAADITVFLSSPSGPKVAGKISRHVSLVHYPEPEELIALEPEAKKAMPMSSKTTLTSSSHHHSTSSKSQRTPHSQSRSRSTHISKRSSVSEVSDGSKHSKRTKAETSRYSNQSAQESGRGQSDVTFSGSSELSHRKKKRKTDSEA
ncbi:Mediator-associated protein 2, partial [Bienertia sinuspersici]